VSRAALLLEALELKELERAGWLRVGVVAPESVAAHSWGVAWLALLLCPVELDRERVLTIALVHDLPEVRVGDITPHDGVSEGDKHAIEAAAAAGLLGGAPRLLAAWQEYAEDESAEARFVHVLDKLDMALQAIRYAQAQGIDTGEFIESARRKVPATLWEVVESVLG
jgi:putative hydrolase of HD superfamily